MNIFVCVKRVPDTETRVQVGADGYSLNPSGVNYILNPYDEFAVEAALQTKEKAGAGEVTVLSVGPAEAAQTIRQALAMGADRGVLLKVGDLEALDPQAVARVLADHLEGCSFDMVWFGRLAIDDQSYAVGPALATHLGLPCATEVMEFEAAGRKASLTRVVEGDHVRMEVELPAVFGAAKGLYEPRFASLKGIMGAKKKPIETVEAKLPATATLRTRMELPPARQAGRWIGEGVDAVPELLRRLREEAKVL